MSDNSTTRMISAYMQEATPPGFLSGFFQSPAQNFHNTEKVEIDVVREDEDVAVVVTDLAAGGRQNEINKYVNKGFTPPIYDEEGAITAYDMIKRQPGANPFADPNYGANAMVEAFRIFRVLENKIRRAIELMASQVLQTGILSLKDKTGTVLYTLDYKPKATHHVTVGTAWAANGSTGDPLADVEALAIVVRRDGKRNPTKLVFGTTAWQRWLANAAVKERLRMDGLPIGQLAPQTRGKGATFQGFIWIGSYRFEMWTYDADYKDPQSGILTPYVTADKVIMLSDGARLDLTYGGIPRIVEPDPRAMPFLPPRMSNSELGLDLSTNAWITPNGRSLMVSAGTRPLTIPTAIDTYGTLDVVP